MPAAVAAPRSMNVMLRDREGGCIAQWLSEEGERREEHRDPWWVQQQHVAIGKLSMGQGDRCTEVHAVVIAAKRQPRSGVPKSRGQAQDQREASHE
jgi:hypothetical protein